MNLLLRLAIIALLSVSGALLVVFLMAWIADPDTYQFRIVFTVTSVCIAAVLIPQK